MIKYSQKLKAKRKLLFFAILGAFALTACQKPDKKASDASIYSEGLQALSTLEQSLRQKGIDLDSAETYAKISHPNPTDKQRVFPEIKDYLKPGFSIDVVQGELTRFVVAAEKLLQLGESKTVVFPEKEKIFQQNQVAAFFLADIMKDKYFSVNSEIGSITEAVDRHEFAIRFARMTRNLAALSEAGFPVGEYNLNLPAENRWPWALAVYEAIAKAMPGLAGYSYAMREILKNGGRIPDEKAEPPKARPEESKQESTDAEAIVRDLKRKGIDLDSSALFEEILTSGYQKPDLESLVQEKISKAALEKKLETYLSSTATEPTQPTEKMSSKQKKLIARRIVVAYLLARLYMEHSLKDLSNKPQNAYVAKYEFVARMARYKESIEKLKSMKFPDGSPELAQFENGRNIQRDEALIACKLYTTIIRDITRIEAAIEANNEIQTEGIKSLGAAFKEAVRYFKGVRSALVKVFNFQDPDLRDENL